MGWKIFFDEREIYLFFISFCKIKKTLTQFFDIHDGSKSIRMSIEFSRFECIDSSIWKRLMFYTNNLKGTRGTIQKNKTVLQDCWISFSMCKCHSPESSFRYSRKKMISFFLKKGNIRRISFLIHLRYQFSDRLCNIFFLLKRSSIEVKRVWYFHTARKGMVVFWENSYDYIFSIENRNFCKRKFELIGGFYSSSDPCF